MMSGPGFLGLTSPDVPLDDAPVFTQMKNLPTDREECGDRQEPSLGMGRVIFRARLVVAVASCVRRSR